MRGRTDKVQKEQLWGVVFGQAIVLIIMSLLLLRACSVSANASASSQAIETQREPALQQDVLIAQAENRIADNNILGGLALLDVTITQGQPSARVFGARAAAYVRIGDYDNAILDYTQATSLAPDNGDYQFGLCYTQVQVGQYQSALPACSNALQIMPNHFMSWNNRCYIRAYHAGDYEGAVSDCSQAIQIDPNHPYPYNNRARAYLMMGSYQQAISDATRSIMLNNPHSYLALTNRGTAYLALGNGTAALADYETAINSNPEYDEVYARLGELYRWQNESALARQAYCQYLTITDAPLQIVLDRINELGGCG
ncbi:MAG: tetratricopeptide repeat protein [Chloroflexota bacterium]